MTKILTFFEYKDDEVLRNHQHYAQRYGYSHEWVDTSFLAHELLRVAYKYNYLLQHLKASPDGGLVMLLDGHTAIFHPISIDEMMVGRDAFVCYGSENTGGQFAPMNNLFIVRNTVENRARLHEMLLALHCRLAAQTHHLDELGWLKAFEVMPTNAAINDCYINIHWAIDNWQNARVFAIHLGMNTFINETGETRRDMLHDSRLEKLLFKHVTNAMIEGKEALPMPSYDAISHDAVSHFNPDARIAFVTLYTHDHASYARISEHNVKRYCDRHGYAYHVYRELPSELTFAATNADSLKPHLLQKHMGQHDWIIWLDADMLFLNPAQKIEPLLNGRDALFAKDAHNGSINSGLMAFKNTPQRLEQLTQLCQRMRDTHDKSTIYSAMVDQHLLHILSENTKHNGHNLVSRLTTNIAPAMTNADTLLNHYVSTSEPYRSIYMAHDDALTLRRG